MSGIAYGVKQAAEVIARTPGGLAASRDVVMTSLRSRVNSAPALAGYDDVAQLSAEYIQALDEQKEVYNPDYGDVENELGPGELSKFDVSSADDQVATT